MQKKEKVQKKENQKTQWLAQCHNPNGYVREKTLRHMMTLTDDAFDARFNELFNILLQRQNDHVQQVREVAFHLLMQQIRFCHLEQLLANAHRILNLKNQSRSRYQPIHQKFIRLLVQPYSFQAVKAYLYKHQGKAVRAIYDFLVLSKKISDDELLEISVSARDIGVNKHFIFMTEFDMEDKMETLIPISFRFYKKKQFSFELLLNIMPTEDVFIWGQLTLDFFSFTRPTSAQRKKLTFILAQKGLTIEDLAQVRKKPYRMSYQSSDFDLILQDIQHKKPQWQQTLLDFSPTATLFQLETVYFYLHRTYAKIDKAWKIS